MFLSSLLKFEEAPIGPRQKINEIPLRFFTVKTCHSEALPAAPWLADRARFHSQR